MKRRSPLSLLLSVLACTAAPSPILGSDPVTLAPDDLSPFDEFGEALDIDGDTVVIGKHNDDEMGLSAGAAYIFERDDSGSKAWLQLAKLTGESGGNFDFFGESVAIDGDIIVVGAPGDDDAANAAGALYVFQQTGESENAWRLAAKLTARDARENQNLGHVVDISGNRIAASAWFDNPLGQNSGAAYLFELGPDGWEEIARLVPEESEPFDNFGITIAIDGDAVVVGADESDDLEENPRPIPGSAHLFQRDAGTGEWTATQKLTAEDDNPVQRFGRSVGISGDTIAIGASGAFNAAGRNTGAVFIFERASSDSNSFTQVDKLAPDDLTDGSTFGFSLRLKQDALIAGAPNAEVDRFESAGAAYVFTRDSRGRWNSNARLLSNEVGRNVFFGMFVAIFPGTAMVGIVDRFIPIGGQQGFVGIFPLQPGRVLVYAVPTDVQIDPDMPSDYSALFGKGEDLGQDWRQSPWFGLYNASFFPFWIYHGEHAWTWVDPSSTETAIFLFDLSSQGWFFTERRLYPNLYSFALTSWIYYFTGTSSPRQFIDLENGAQVWLD